MIAFHRSLVAYVSGFGFGFTAGVLISTMLLARFRRRAIAMAEKHFEALCQRLREGISP